LSSCQLHFSWCAPVIASDGIAQTPKYEAGRWPTAALCSYSPAMKRAQRSGSNSVGCVGEQGRRWETWSACGRNVPERTRVPRAGTPRITRSKTVGYVDVAGLGTPSRAVHILGRQHTRLVTT